MNLPSHAADRLIEAIEKKRAPVCVGLDPVVARLPVSLQPAEEDSRSMAQALQAFCVEVLHAIKPYVPCVKIQSACFERFREAGVRALWAVLEEAKSQEFQVILDAKRGDIGPSADHYAAGAFDSPDQNPRGHCPDWITINPYFGKEGISPFLRPGWGAFAIVQTSNPDGQAIQSLRLESGKTIAEAVGELLAETGRDCVGRRGYSALGAVVGIGDRQATSRLRAIMPQQVFLVPGYGVQGGNVEDVLPCFRSDGTGAIISASRSVIYAFKSTDPKWAGVVAEASENFADLLGHAVGMR